MSGSIRLPVVSNPECRKALQTQINTLANVTTSAFPGPIPVSLSRADLWKLGGRTHYLVSPKSDGIRTLLVTMRHQEQSIAALGNRTRTLYFAIVKAGSGFFQGSLFDGEYLADRNLYLVFDCFAFNGLGCTHLDYLTRLQVADIAVRTVVNEPTVGGGDVRTSTLRMQIKPVYDLKHLARLVSDVMPKLDYATDGLVFTPMAFQSGALHPGPDEDLLKWKPLHERTFDFKMLLDGGATGTTATPPAAAAASTAGTTGAEDEDYPVTITLWACVFSERTQQFQDVFQGKVMTSCQALCTKLGIQEPHEADRKIVECNREGKQYRLVRLREDKNNPNTQQTVKATLKDIEENITIQDLIEFVSRKPNGGLRATRRANPVWD